MRHPLQSLSAVTAFLIAPSLSHATDAPSKGTFLYSNECIEAESGGATGGALKLVHAPKTDRLTYEWSAKGLIELATATEVHIGPQKADGDSEIHFTIPPIQGTIYDGLPHNFSGTISKTEVRISGLGIPAVIPRQELDFKPEQCPPNGHN